MSIAKVVSALGDAASVDEPLGPLTTYRIGGPAAVLCDIDSTARLETLVAVLDDDDRVLVIGNGSNLLVADEGFDGIAVHLVGEFEDLSWRDEGDRVRVHAGAGLSLPIAARRLARDAVTGFEWAVGVPGTFGGAAVMNAGGHGSDLAASLRQVRFMDRSGRLITLVREEIDFGYRRSSLPANVIVTEVELELDRGDAVVAEQTIKDIVAWRREHQPGGANAGSVFKNPPGDSAGALIDRAGLKGLRIGGASVSTKHANFIQLDHGARSADVYELANEVARLVNERLGVTLERELRVVGFGDDHAR